MRRLLPFLVLSASPWPRPAASATSAGGPSRRVGPGGGAASVAGSGGRRRPGGARVLEEEEGFDADELTALRLSGYFVKYEGCRATARVAGAEEEEEQEEQEGGGGIDEDPWTSWVSSQGGAGGGGGGSGRERRRLDQDEGRPGRGVVTFRLCADYGNANACDASCDSSEHGALEIDMDAYLRAVTEHQWEALDRRCETCSDCLGEAEGGRCDAVDVATCYDECETFDNMEENGYLDAAEFVGGCGRLGSFAGEELYVGAVCDSPWDSRGGKINVGVYLDEDCTVWDTSRNVGGYLTNGDGLSMKLSHAVLKKTYDPNECVATCLEDDAVVAGEVPEISQVCEDLYRSSSPMPGYDHHDHVPEVPYEDHHTATPSPTFTSPPTEALCLYQDEKGTWFAGRRCEFEATAVCAPPDKSASVQVIAMDPRFCTNGGTCLPLGDAPPGPSGGGRICACPPGFAGDRCEFPPWDDEEGEDGWGWDVEEDEHWGDHDHDGDEHYWEDGHAEEDASGWDHGHDDEGQEAEEDAWAHAFWSDDGALLNYTARDRRALELFYRLARGYTWRNSEGWLTDASVCTWHGVTCDAGLSVASLALNGNSVAGSMYDIYHAALRQLANLTFLDLSGNQISGTVPERIGDDLVRLEGLRLGNNWLSGSVPSSISKLPNLRTLELQGNSFSWIQMNRGYASLERLDLGNNELSGTVQYDLSRLSTLEYVSLSNNRLSAAGLPNDYSLLVDLASFDISRNKLFMDFPYIGFSGNPKLRHLNLSRTYFSGNINEDIMEAAMESNDGPYELDLSFNQFSGTLPNFDVDLLNINVVGNILSAIDPAACDQVSWNDGATGSFLCDGIACAIGTSNSEGRQTSSEDPCVPCDASLYYGTVGCHKGHEESHYDIISSPNDDFVGEDDWADGDRDCPLDCFNGGFCTVRFSPFGADYWCRCVGGYTGERCEIMSSYRPSPPPSILPWVPGFPGYRPSPPPSIPPWVPGFPGSSPTTLSYVQVVSPDYLIKNDDGYDHQVALFGPPTFKDRANVYYVDSDLCDRIPDVADWQLPFILMVDRGQCTFVRKVRNAQYMGALAVVVADNTCLCDAGDSCALGPDEKCEPNWPVMADDGCSAADIIIPSFLIFKQDATQIKEELGLGNDVVMEMYFHLERIPGPTPRPSWHRPTPPQSWYQPTPFPTRYKPTPPPSWYEPTPPPSLSSPENPAAIQPCVFQNLTGTWFAGRRCEFAATSECEPVVDGGPLFCTNGGMCATFDTGGESCVCLDGFHGNHCELVWEGEGDHEEHLDEEEEEEHLNGKDHEEHLEEEGLSSAVLPSNLNATFNSTIIPGPSSSVEPSMAPSSQVTAPPSGISTVSTQPTAIATDPDPEFLSNPGQYRSPQWQFLLLIFPLVL